MLICVYDTANEAEILKAKIAQVATATYRKIAYRVCRRYESFVNECKKADGRLSSQVKHFLDKNSRGER